MTSIRDIAERARVSIGTVDRVLHNRGRVSLRTRALVDKIVHELDYRPNIYARNLSLNRVYRFGVLMPRLTQDSGYWSIPARGIHRAQEELEPSRVRVRLFCYDRYVDQSFARAYKTLRAWDPDGMLIAPVLPAAAQGSLTGTLPRCPYVLFDSQIPGSAPLCTITQDGRRAGLLAAHLMQRMIHERGTILVVRVIPQDFHIGERVGGFLEGLAGNRRWTLRVSDVDSRRGARSFADALRSFRPNLRGVYVSNAWTHALAPRAPRSSGHHPCIIGYDLVARNRTMLTRGMIDVLISQRPARQGYEGILVLYRSIVLRETVPRSIRMPLDILTSDNVPYYHD
jgi:LacI family transcriptional regulator